MGLCTNGGCLGATVVPATVEPLPMRRFLLVSSAAIAWMASGCFLKVTVRSLSHETRSPSSGTSAATAASPVENREAAWGERTVAPRRPRATAPRIALSSRPSSPSPSKPPLPPPPVPPRPDPPPTDPSPPLSVLGPANRHTFLRGSRSLARLCLGECDTCAGLGLLAEPRSAAAGLPALSPPAEAVGLTKGAIGAMIGQYN